jgi:hypothetical protein
MVPPVMMISTLDSGYWVAMSGRIYRSRTDGSEMRLSRWPWGRASRSERAESPLMWFLCQNETHVRRERAENDFGYVVDGSEMK